MPQNIALFLRHHVQGSEDIVTIVVPFVTDEKEGGTLIHVYSTYQNQSKVPTSDLAL